MCNSQFRTLDFRAKTNGGGDKAYAMGGDMTGCAIDKKKYGLCTCG